MRRINAHKMLPTIQKRAQNMSFGTIIEIEIVSHLVIVSVESHFLRWKIAILILWCICVANIYVTWYWLPARWASGFCCGHQQNNQGLWFPHCYSVIYVRCPSLFVFCWKLLLLLLLLLLPLLLLLLLQINWGLHIKEEETSFDFLWRSFLTIHMADVFPRMPLMT